MRYQYKTKDQLIAELAEMRRQIAGLKALESDRKRAEEARRESEEKYWVLVEKARDGVVIVQDEVHKFANTAMTEISGYSNEEIVGMHYLHMVTPEYRQLVTERYQLLVQGKQVPLVYDSKIRHKDGAVRNVELSTGVITYDGRPASMAIVRDITERKVADDRLREGEEWFRSLYEQSPIGIILHDSNGRVVRINKACLDIFGISNLNLEEATTLFEESNLPRKAKKTLSEGKTVRYEGPFDFGKATGPIWEESSKSGIIYVDVMITPLVVPKAKGAVTGYLVQVQDVTERRHAQDRLRDLSRRLVEVHEIERRRISRELHDQVGQVLTGVKLAVETASRLPAERAKQRLSETQTCINELITAVKNLSLDLRPSMLDDMGLMPTLLWHFERYTAQTSVRVKFRQSGADRRFGPEVETAVYRITQEALTNVARHARVPEVTVRLSASHNTLTLEIEDHGSGFDPELALRGDASSGLLGMRERAIYLGGRLTVDSVPGHGTRLTAELPLQNSDEPGIHK